MSRSCCSEEVDIPYTPLDHPALLIIFFLSPFSIFLKQGAGKCPLELWLFQPDLLEAVLGCHWLMIGAFYLQKGMFSIPFPTALLILIVSLCPLSISPLFPFPAIVMHSCFLSFCLYLYSCVSRDRERANGLGIVLETRLPWGSELLQLHFLLLRSEQRCNCIAQYCR